MGRTDRPQAVVPGLFDRLVNLLDGIRVDFSDGWGLLRASNTTPALLLRFEAASETSLDRIQQKFRDLLCRADPTLGICF